MLINLPAATAESNVTLVIINNPFNISDRTIKTVETPEAQSLELFLNLNASIPDGQEYHASINGRVYGPEELAGAYVLPGDSVAVCPVLKGGSGGSKNPLAILAGIALTVFAFGVVGPLFGHAAAGGLTLAGKIAAGATMAIGGQLIGNALGPSADSGRDDQSYKWGALQPIQAQGAVMPITYGTVRTAGQVLNQRITVKDDTQYLQILLSGGEGPVNEISDVRINDNEASNYQDVTVSTQRGTNNQTVIAGFGSLYNNQAVGVNLEVGRNSEGKLDEKLPGEWSVREIDGDAADCLEVTLDFPEGLGFYYESHSGNGENWVRPEFQYSRQNSGGSWGLWTAWFTEDFRGSEPKAFTKVRTTDKLTPGRYRVRGRMLAKRAVNYPRDRTTTVWTSLTAITEQAMTHPNKVLVGIRVKATDQLNSGIPTITWKQRRDTVLVFENGAWVSKDAQNPAWIIYDIIVKARRLTDPSDPSEQTSQVHVFGEPPERVDLPAFRAWAEWNGREINNRPALKMNLMIDESRQMWEWVSAVAASARGCVVLKGTKVSCIWDQPSAHTQIFTMGNIKAGSFGGEFLPLESRADAVEISFLNEAKNYEREQITVYGDGYDGRSAANPASIQLTGITDFERAYREGLYMLNQNKYILRTVTFAVSMDAVACQVGDVIKVQHDVPQWGQGGRILAVSGGAPKTLRLDRMVRLAGGVAYRIIIRRLDDTMITLPVQSPGGGGTVETDEITVSSAPGVAPYDLFALGEAGKEGKPFRVRQITRGGNKEDLEMTLTCTEYIAELYTEAGVIPVIDYSGGTNEIANLAFAAAGYYGNNGDWIPELWAHWSYRGQKPIAYEIQWKYDNDLWGAAVRTIESPAQCLLKDTASLYSVRARGVFGDLPPTAWAYATFAASQIGVGIAPDAPANLSVNGWFGFARLSWVNPPQIDLAYTEVWEADEDNREEAVLAGRAAAPVFEYTRLIASGAVKWYWVRSANRAGQKSDFNAAAGTPCVIAPGSHEEYMDALLSENPYLRETIDGLHERIEPIEAEVEGITGTDIPEIKDALIPDLRGRIRDAEDEIQGRLAPALEMVSQGVLRLADESGRTRNVFRWAGFEVNAEEGRVIIRAVEDLKTETGYQLSDVEQRLDAQSADISLRATRTYVDELAASLISSITVSEEWKFSGDLRGWTGQNAALEAYPAGMRYTVEGENPSLTSPDIEIDGETDNIIGLQFRAAGEGAASSVQCRIQYSTAGHGYSDAHMKRVSILGGASVFRSVQADMHGLDAGGDDWRESVITGIRVCLGGEPGEEYDISLVNIGQSSLTDVALEGLRMRVTQAEIDIDGARAAILLKADQTVIEGLTNKMDKAEIDINALGNSITLKADRAELGPLESRITGAEVGIDALDGRISQQVTDYQGARESIDGLAEADIEGSLSEAEGEERRREKLALARQELTAKIEEANTAIAEYNLALTAMIDANRADYRQRISAVASELEAETGIRETLAAEVAGQKAAILNEESARVSADAAETQARQTLATRVSGNEAAIQTEAQARASKDGALEAKYGVRLDANGYVSGYVQNNNGETSNFIISADYFMVVRPGYTSASQMLVYDSALGKLSLNQIYVNGAFIKEATVDTLRLGQRSVTIPEGISGSCYDSAWSAGWKKLVYDNSASTPVQLTVSGLEEGQPVWLEMTCLVMLRRASGAHFVVVPSTMTNPGHPLTGGVIAPVFGTASNRDEYLTYRTVSAAGKFVPSRDGTEVFSILWISPSFVISGGVTVTEIIVRGFSLLALQCKR